MERSDRQYRGALGWAVDRMIFRSVRKGFHTVRWLPPQKALPEPSILVANHHGWYDGYLMYLASRKLELRVVDWIQEYDAFPLFGRVGGMPFPNSDVAARGRTVRQTVRLMRSAKISLILFAEGELHRPDALLPFGKSLEFMARKVPDASIVPVAIRYEMAMHERPEAFLAFGDCLSRGERLAERARLEIAAMLDRLRARTLLEPETYQTLLSGTPDVNERWDMRRIRGSRTSAH